MRTAMPWLTRLSFARLLLLSALLGAAVSTQFLFQPFVWRHWSLDEVFAGWLEVLRDRLVVCAWLAGACWPAVRAPLPKPRMRSAAVGLAITVGAGLGEATLMAIGAPAAAVDPASLAARVLRWSCVAAALVGLYLVWQRTLQIDSAARRAQRAQGDTESQLTLLRLQALRAQIEPHFLFNTLATVQRLAKTDPQGAMRLLDHLHKFVSLSSQATPELRRWTMGQELDLVRAYLDVIVLRMDGRLRVDIISEPGLVEAEFPPLLLATLAENAVKHGITPSTRGGTITVSVRRDAETLQVRVVDDGVGFHATAGTGIGLANSRARLRTLFGERASLSLAAKHPHGVVAMVRLPVAREAA